MQRILFYSFKGGTGRTTAAANVGVALARRGHNVLFVDLDIDGGGLHIVLEHELEPEKGTIQEYLDVSASPKSHVDVRDYLHECDGKFGQKGEMWLLPAFQGPNRKKATPNFQEDEIEARLRGFFDEVRRLRTRVDYVILDSPSGYSDMTNASFNVADGALILYRLNGQALAGTLNMLESLKDMQKSRQGHFEPSRPLRDFFLVAAGVPAEPELYDWPTRFFATGCGRMELNKAPIVEIPDSAHLRFHDAVVVHSMNPVFVDVRREFNRLAEEIERLFPPETAA